MTGLEVIFSLFLQAVPRWVPAGRLPLVSGVELSLHVPAFEGRFRQAYGRME